MSFASWLSDKMREHRINQTELAGRLGVTRGAINNLLMGRSKNPSDDTIQKLSDIFHVSTDDIYRVIGKIDPIPEQDQWMQETQRKIARFRTERYKKIVLSMMDLLSQQEQEELKSKK